MQRVGALEYIRLFLKKMGSRLISSQEPGGASWEASALFTPDLLTSGCSGTQTGCSFLLGLRLRGSRYKDMTAQGEDQAGRRAASFTQPGWKAGGWVECGDQVTLLPTCPGSSLITFLLAWRNGGGPTLQGNTLLLPP